MVDTKKEQEREELHRAIWAIADDLRGAVDGWDFKSYVLGTMFYRYISENIASYINQGEIDAGNPDFRYEDMPDAEAEQAREGLVQEKGFFILPSELFCNVRAKAASDENLNETLETVFRHIEESAKGSSSEGQFAGLFDDYDVNSNKLGATVAKRNEKLVKLLNGVADMNLGDVKEHDIDAFGDAYEYLMTMYASNAGKSGGEFFTPADVSELLPRLVCWLRRARQTWPLLCTRWHGWLPTVRLQSSVSLASCTVAAQSRKFASIWWTTTLLTVSSSCRATCSLVPVLPPASWC